jgi:ABC-type multidrug transport system fused ATPase/permease subunit
MAGANRDHCSIGGLIASLRIFNAALNGILRSPIAFFDTTPMGRILSRFSKDQESMDNEVANVLYSVSFGAPSAEWSLKCF